MTYWRAFVHSIQLDWPLWLTLVVITALGIVLAATFQTG